MDLEADIIEFRVPTENNKTIFIWDIQASLSEAHIYVSRENKFFSLSGFSASSFL